MVALDFKKSTTELIGNLKNICAAYRLGNDGNEFKIITQVFMYKFLCDKLAYELKKADKATANAQNWEQHSTSPVSTLTIMKC